jgi:hypothetical protein
MNKKLNDATPSEWDRATWEQFANVGPEAWEQPDGYNTEQDEDMVNSPSHYTYGKVECIEGIEESMTPEAFKGYCKGACLKYLWRYERKDKPLEDLQKCQWYLNRLVGVVEAENNKSLAKADEISELVELIDYSELERLESLVGAAACKWNTACNNTELANASDHSYADYSKAVAHAAEELRAAVKALEDHDVGQYL